MAVRILVVEATRTGRWAWRCQRTAPVAASMTTAVRASTRGAVGAAAAGVAIHPTTTASARTREGNPRGGERTPVGCTNQWNKCNTLDPDWGGSPGRRGAATGAAAG